METLEPGKVQVVEFDGLNRTMQYGNSIAGGSFGVPLRMFKSYYVVWKQHRLGGDEYGQMSLNRTMQYGNLWAKKSQTSK